MIPITLFCDRCGAVFVSSAIEAVCPHCVDIGGVR